VNEEREIKYAPQQLSDYLLLSPQDLTTYIQKQVSMEVGIAGERDFPPFLFCGEISPASRTTLQSLMQDKGLFVQNISAVRHASTLATLALQRLEDGKEDDPMLLEPLYLRRPSITTSARKQPLLGGKLHRTTDSSTTEREEGALRH
jgi:tRNA threonylcarbamoyladenosine biosynthesis protein TsaB